MSSAQSDWEKTLEKATARDSDVAPGVVLAAVDKNGKFLYKKAAGFQSRLPDAPPIREDGIMWIASCTKLITSVCALQCVERGQVTLDEDLGKSHLPELANRQVISLDNSKPEGFSLRPAKNPITLRTLLTHSSGFSYEWGDDRLAAWRASVGPIPEEKRGLMTANHDLPLLFDPGEGWVYGGGNDWAGVLVGRLNNKKLGEYMKENVFEPLGMDATTHHLDKRPDLQERVVGAGKREDDGSLTPHQGPVYPAARDDSGGGGLWSCVPDYIKVLGDLIKDEPKLLKRETVLNYLAKGQITNENSLKELVQSRVAVSANAANAVDAGLNYGLGGLVMTKASEASGFPAGTLTWGGLPNLKWVLHPTLGFAALYATQVLPYGDEKNIALSGDFFREVMRLAQVEAV